MERSVASVADPGSAQVFSASGVTLSPNLYSSPFMEISTTIVPSTERRLKETLIKALPRQGESEKALEYQHVKPKAFMLI
jgi:hypothetical protein